MKLDFESFRAGYIMGYGPGNSAESWTEGYVRRMFDDLKAIMQFPGDPPEPTAGTEGWIKHAGKFCPCPHGMLVDVKFGDGEVATANRASEWGWGWVRATSASDDEIDFWRPAR
jgi:hypothetical protein